MQSHNGCDSIARYNLVFENEVLHIDSLGLCQGDSIFYNGHYYSSDTILIDTLQGIQCIEINQSIIYTIPNINFTFSDTIIDLGDYIEIELPFDSDRYSFSWMPSEIIDDPNGKNVLITPENESTIGIEITDQVTGCIKFISFQIYLNETNSLNEIPNVFSPNNDGINDEWVVDFSDHPENETFIYDRWGNLVGYWKNATQINWDGTKTLNNISTGEFLAQGVYIMVMKYGNIEYKVGDITLLK